MSSEPETLVMKLRTDRKFALKFLKVTAFMVLSPALWFTAEAAQMIVMVSLLGLAVRLPSGDFGTGLAAYGAWALIRSVVGGVRKMFAKPESSPAPTHNHRNRTGNEPYAPILSAAEKRRLVEMVNNLTPKGDSAKPVKADEGGRDSVGPYL